MRNIKHTFSANEFRIITGMDIDRSEETLTKGYAVKNLLDWKQQNQ